MCFNTLCLMTKSFFNHGASLGGLIFGMYKNNQFNFNSKFKINHVIFFLLKSFYANLNVVNYQKEIVGKWMEFRSYK